MRPRAKAFMAKVAEHCATMARCHEAAMKGDEMDHAAAMQSHLDLGDCCVEMAKALADDEFQKRGDGLQPTGVSAIAPTAPEHVRAIPRFGQRDISREDMPTLQIFEALTKVD